MLPPAHLGRPRPCPGAGLATCRHTFLDGCHFLPDRPRLLWLHQRSAPSGAGPSLRAIWPLRDFLSASPRIINLARILSGGTPGQNPRAGDTVRFMPMSETRPGMMSRCVGALRRFRVGIGCAPLQSLHPSPAPCDSNTSDDDERAEKLTALATWYEAATLDGQPDE